MKKICCIVLVVLIMINLIGCYFDDSESRIINNEVDYSNLDIDKTKITVLSSSYVEEPEGEVLQMIADDFMETYPNIEVEFVGVPMNNAEAVITNLAIKGELPDIFVNAQELMLRFYDLNICKDLNLLLDKEYLSGFDPNIVESVTVNGEMQFFPWFVGTMAIIYRVDLFEEENLEVPETWEEFITVAQKLTKDTDGDGEIDQWGFCMFGAKNTSGLVRFTNILRSFGAYEVKLEDGKWVTNIDTDKGKEAFEFFGDLYKKYGVVPKGPLEVSYKDSNNMMANGTTAMVLTGPHSFGAIKKLNPNLDGKLGSFIIPKKDHHTSTLTINGFSISKDCQNTDEAILFLKFLAKKENQIKWYETTGRMPARTEATIEKSKNNQQYAGFFEAYNYIEPIPRVVFYSELVDILGDAYQRILLDSIEVDDAVESAAVRIRQCIEESQ